MFGAVAAADTAPNSSQAHGARSENVAPEYRAPSSQRAASALPPLWEVVRGASRVGSPVRGGEGLRLAVRVRSRRLSLLDGARRSNAAQKELSRSLRDGSSQCLNLA